MAEKSFLEIFNRYKPTDTEILRVLSRVQKTSVRADKEKRFIQAEVFFDEIVHKDVLYRIENEIKTAYSLNYVKLLPKYPANLFDKIYVVDGDKVVDRIPVTARGMGK